MKAQTGSGIWGYRLREKASRSPFSRMSSLSRVSCEHLLRQTAVYLGQSTAFEEEAPEDEDQPRNSARAHCMCCTWSHVGVLHSQGSGSLNLTLLEEKLDPCAHKSKDEACQDPFTYSIKVSSSERGCAGAKSASEAMPGRKPTIDGWHYSLA